MGGYLIAKTVGDDSNADGVRATDAARGAWRVARRGEGGGGGGRVIGQRAEGTRSGGRCAQIVTWRGRLRAERRGSLGTRRWAMSMRVPSSFIQPALGSG